MREKDNRVMTKYTTGMGISNNDSNIFITTINTTTTSSVVIFKLITPDNVYWYFRLISYGILGQIMAVMGSITNIINIIIFLKLGVRKDPMNVSLLGLSISDFGSCFTVMYLNLCLTPGFAENEDLPFSPAGTLYLYSTWPHLIFVKITVCITAFITIERCLCVTYPLKIKQLFNPKRVAIITTSMYLFILGITAPIYHIFRMEWVFIPERNRTLYTLVYHEDRPKIEPPVFTLFGVIVPFVTFFATILATVILVHNLKKNAKWRASVTTTTGATATSDIGKTQQSSTSSTTTNTSSLKNSRDQRVAKMVVIISTLYIVCNLPVTISTIAVLAVPELSQGGAYHNTVYLIFSLNYLFESTNASLNIFIYYKMSSNYKSMLQNVFFSSSSSFT